MVKNHDASDVRGLEEVFRSQEISRTSGRIGSEPRASSLEGRDVALLRRMFGHASSALRDLHVTTTREPGCALREDRAGDGAGRGSHAGAPLRGGLVGWRWSWGSERTVASAGPPWKRRSSRYRTIAACSAVVALVVAGVTAGTAQHGPSNRSAQGAHGTAGPHGLIALPGTVSTGPTAPGSITGSVGSGALTLGTPRRRRTRFGQRTGWTCHAHWSGNGHRHALGAGRWVSGRWVSGRGAAVPLVRCRARAAAIR